MPEVLEVPATQPTEVRSRRADNHVSPNSLQFEDTKRNTRRVDARAETAITRKFLGHESDHIWNPSSNPSAAVVIAGSNTYETRILDSQTVVLPLRRYEGWRVAEPRGSRVNSKCAEFAVEPLPIVAVRHVERLSDSSPLVS